mmetsp:Transcript_43490/g.69585  ORF Transcript_43490/g.69585 Transcript_43490/m.69585 type:complete len:304 (+) Transcript_43490:936-1847(+)
MMFLVFHPYERGMGFFSSLCMCMWLGMMVNSGSNMLNMLDCQLDTLAYVSPETKRDTNVTLLKKLKVIAEKCAILFTILLLASTFGFSILRAFGHYYAANRISLCYYVASIVWGFFWTMAFACYTTALSNALQTHVIDKSSQEESARTKVVATFLSQIFFFKIWMSVVSFLCIVLMLVLMIEWIESADWVGLSRFYLWYCCQISTVACQYAGYFFVNYHGIMNNLVGSSLTGHSNFAVFGKSLFRSVVAPSSQQKVGWGSPRNTAGSPTRRTSLNNIKETGTETGTHSTQTSEESSTPAMFLS